MSYFDIRTSYPIRSGSRLFWKQDRTILYLDNTPDGGGPPSLARPIFFSLFSFLSLSPSLSHSGSAFFSSLRSPDFPLPPLPSLARSLFLSQRSCNVSPKGSGKESDHAIITFDIKLGWAKFRQRVEISFHDRKHISINVPLRTQHNSGNVRGKLKVSGVVNKGWQFSATKRVFRRIELTRSLRAVYARYPGKL